MYFSEMVRIQIRIIIKQPDPDPYQIEQQDPYESEKQDPDPYQKGLDPQHCFRGAGSTRHPGAVEATVAT
jgi:hypothetical protein